MKKITRFVSVILIVLMTVLMVPSGAISASAAGGNNWAGSWGTPAIESGVVVGSDSVLASNGVHLRDYIGANSTVRTVITPTLGGSKIRLKFSNIYGKKAVTFNEVTIAKTGATDDVVLKDTITQVTFNGGNKAITVASGSEVYTDEINFNSTALEKLSVSYYFKSNTPIYVEGLYGGTSYLCGGLGNRTHSETMTSIATKLNFTSNSITYNTIPFLTRVDVYAKNAYCVVIAGDSTVTNDAYLILEKKLRAAGITNVGVVMSGIIGNSLLHDGVGLLGKIYGESFISRYKRDALDVAGVKYIIIKIGINDILHPMSNSMRNFLTDVSPSDVINGYKNISEQAMSKSVLTYLCTSTPYKGYTRNFLGDNDLVWSQTAENKILEINSWIRITGLNYFTGAINLDQMRDPSDSTKLRSQMTIDGIHFSNLGQVAFVDLIPETAYGVSGKLTSAAKVLGVDPYTAQSTQPTTQKTEATTKKPSQGATNSGSTPTTQSHSSSIVLPNISSPTTSGSSSGETTTAVLAGAVIPSGNETTTLNASQILVNNTTADSIAAGSMTDDNSSSSAAKQIAGYSILAAVAVAIIAVAAVLLLRMRTNKKPLTRTSSGVSKKKHRI